MARPAQLLQRCAASALSSGNANELRATVWRNARACTGRRFHDAWQPLPGTAKMFGRCRHAKTKAYGCSKSDESVRLRCQVYSTAMAMSLTWPSRYQGRALMTSDVCCAFGSAFRLSNTARHIQQCLTHDCAGSCSQANGHGEASALSARWCLFPADPTFSDMHPVLHEQHVRTVRHSDLDGRQEVGSASVAGAGGLRQQCGQAQRRRGDHVRLQEL